MKRFLSILTVGFLLAGVVLQVLKVFFKFENIPILAALICIAIAGVINFLKQKLKGQDKD
ncbi:hypothetical protein OAO52_06725 [Flavobacteriaceae bacterium]|nr:hypothetical protein [Flavobacteriaceae bacterium]